MESIRYIRDDWPKMSDGCDFNGKQLLTLLRSGNSPFQGVWDVNLLIQEIEEKFSAQVIDIPFVYKGSNNYGFHIKLSNQRDIMARVARADVNMPHYDGFPFNMQVPEVKFEAAVYDLLRSESAILASRLLHYHIPVQHPGPQCDTPQDITGRRFFLFEKAQGENNLWKSLSSKEKACLLTQAALIRASLFDFNLPLEFSAVWLRERLPGQKPESLPIAVAPTRDFCVALFTSKIEATIRNIGDVIGWESEKEADNNYVGPVAAAAKQSLLCLIPHIIPADNDQSSLYRLVLDHGDFGIHNMSITTDVNSQPIVTSLYDWETGCIVPALLSDPLMAVTVDLVTDEDASPSITRLDDTEAPDELEEYMTWANQYFKVLFNQASDYRNAIRTGKDARHVWFSLRDWWGDDPEEYFGKLGAWAEKRIQELLID